MVRALVRRLILAAALAAAAPDVAAAQVRAGVAKIEATWHVGAPAGQYASDGASVGTDYYDPNNFSTRRTPSYGLQGGNWTRALIIEGPDGQRVAVVVNDHYIPQDLVNQRVVGLLAEHDLQVSLGQLPGELATGITDDNLFVSVSHSHSSVYVSTPSWGVWAFQDVFDIRYFEYIAEQMAKAVIAAAQNLRPVRMGAANSPFDKLHRHSFGPAVADDGSPAGYPYTDNDKTVGAKQPPAGVSETFAATNADNHVQATVVESKKGWGAALQVTVGLAEWALARTGELLRGIHDVDGPLLELHRVAAGGDGDADQTLRDVDVAIMVDTDLGDDVAGLPVTDKRIADSHTFHLRSQGLRGRGPGSTPPRTRSWSTRCHGPTLSPRAHAGQGR